MKRIVLFLVAAYQSVQLTRKQSHIEKKTEPDVKLLQTLLGTRNELRKVEEMPALELNEYICKFIISVRSKDRKDYEESMSLLCSEVSWQVFVLSLLIVIFV